MSGVNHTDRKHALLSASGSHRWIYCTPSARLEDKFQESSTSSYAQEGTLAHELSDIQLQHFFGFIDDKVHSKEYKKLEKEILKFYNGNENSFIEMTTEVDKYVTIVIESFREADQRTKGGATILIEERVDFSHLVEDGFGTNDVIILSDGTMEVIDLKYGKGVKVEAKTNSQLMLYSSGALMKHEMSYDIDKVKHTIIQPRLDHYSTWECSTKYLENWGIKVVKPRAKLAYSGEGKKQAGPWCKFCKVKAMCRTLADHNTDLAKFDFQDPHLLSDKELVQIYGQIDMLVDWANSIGKHMLKEAIEGKKWNGYKVVEGRSNRKWADELKVKEVLSKDFMPEAYSVNKLNGITSIERLLGKGNFQTKLGELVIKPQGKPTLVSVEDKRPAMGVEQAKEDFK